jgi:hypothetical protein
MGAAVAQSPGSHHGRAVLGRVAVVAGWVVLALVAASALLIVWQFPSMLDEGAWNADSVMPWVLAQDYSSASRAVGGQYAFPSILWFDLATGWLPLHRMIWQLEPLAVALAITGLVAWPVHRLAGRWAAALAVAIVLCTSPWVMRTYFWSDFHTATFLAAALLAAYLCALILRPGLTRPAPLVASAVAVGVFAGLQLVDPLLIVCGLAPLALAAVAWRLVESSPRVNRALGGLALLVVVAVAIRFATKAIMDATGLVVDNPARLVLTFDPDRIRGNVHLLAQMTFALGNGALELGERGPVRGTLGVAAAGVMALCTITPVALALDALVRIVRRRPLGALETAWRVFWGATVVGLVLAILFTTIATNIDTYRYIVPILFAGAATAPLLLRHGPLVRTLALAACAVYFLAGFVGLTDRTMIVNRGSNDRVLAQLEGFARANGATQGYGEYWFASPITWQSHSRLVLRPVVSCSVVAVVMCRSALGYDERWYRPRAGRTLLVWPPGGGLPKGFPAPVATLHLGMLDGRDATAYVFDTDILPLIQPPPKWD